MSVTPEPSISPSRMRRWIEHVRRIEHRRIVHRDLGAEPPVAEVRPVADFAVADPHDIGQAVARHVGEEDRVGGIAEDEPRAERLVGRHSMRLARAEAFFGQDGVPGEDVVFGDQDVRMTIAGEIDEAEIRTVPADIRVVAERRELFPPILSRPLEESGDRRPELDDI